MHTQLHAQSNLSAKCRPACKKLLAKPKTTTNGVATWAIGELKPAGQGLAKTWLEAGQKLTRAWLEAGQKLGYKPGSSFPLSYVLLLVKPCTGYSGSLS